ncbi:hypothetical protein [Spiroplasma endosymbiont of Tricholauxania praeusta]|uniref:hypothetical protein n=1 Tax=Spiroplasma endosymbiont of Tricholauxania praeusta TaxID=3066296 RepID=UPI0030D615E6
MSQNQVFSWIGFISGSSLLISFILLLMFLLIKFLLNYKQKNKVKRILSSNDFSQIIETKKELKIKVRKYFKEIFIRDVDINLFKKFLKSESGVNKKPTKIAWNFFIILTSSILVNKSEGRVSEAIKSIFNTFDESKQILLTSDKNNLVTDVILKIMNLKIRPILIASRSLTKIDTNGNFIINDENLSKEEIENFWKQIDKVRKDLIENKYLYFISILSLSTATNEQIKKLLNYTDQYKIHKKATL